MIRFPVPTARNTYSLVVTSSPQSSVSPILRMISAHSAYATEVWLMVFAGTAVPDDGSTPVMVPINLVSNASKVDLTIPEGLQVGPEGLVIVASTTENTLTAATSATLYFSAFIEEFEPHSPTGTTVGDLTTSVSSLQVWAESAGPKRLRRVRIHNNVASERYAVIYAQDTPTSASRMVSWFKIPASDDLNWDFGYGGLDVFARDADGTRRVGCKILCQETLTPGDEAAATDFNIEALYI